MKLLQLLSLFLLPGAFVGCNRHHADASAPREFSYPSPVANETLPTVADPPARISPPPAPTNSFAEVAPQARKSVVILSVFDQAGNLRANSHGFFVSADGRFVADRQVVEGAVNAVAKAANGAIYNVTGALHEVGDGVLLKADATDVSFLDMKSGAALNPGDQVAIILSPVERAKELLEEARITAQFTDASGDWFETSPALSPNALGAPVINARGDLVGVVLRRESASIIRPVKAVTDLVAQTAPSVTASWQSFSNPTPTASLSPSAVKSPSPTKIPLRGSRIAYAPAPHYPTELRRSHWPIRGSGSFRISFDARGHAANVQIARSTGNELLDRSALDALRNWRADPGQSWSLNVPVTFNP